MQPVASQRLGYFDDYSQDFADLGEEFVLQDTIVSGELDIVASGQLVTARWVRNQSGGTIQPGRVVKEMATSHHVELAGVGDVGLGVADPRIKQGIPNNAKFLVIRKGPIEVYVSGTVNDGEVSDAGASGESFSGGVASTATSYGTFLEGGTAGQFVRSDVDFENIGAAGASTPTIPDVSANAANIAARDAVTIPAGQQDYTVKVATNQLIYRTIDAGANWAPISYETTVATIAARDALTEVENGQRVAVDAENKVYRWDGAAWQELSGAGEATTYDTAIPSAATGEDGYQSVQVGGSLEGMVFEKSAGTWTYVGQDREPILAAEVVSADAAHTAITAALPVGGSYSYRVFRNSRYEFDTIFQSGIIFRNSGGAGGAGGGSSTPVVFTNDEFILAAADITNGYIDLSGTPGTIENTFFGWESTGRTLSPGTDYTLITNRITWNVATFGPGGTTPFTVGDVISIRWI